MINLVLFFLETKSNILYSLYSELDYLFSIKLLIINIS